MSFDKTLSQFTAYYGDRWPDAATQEIAEEGFTRLIIGSPSLLRDGVGNRPQVLHHGRRTDNAIVLIHGLTDSPYYMQAIAEDFARAGFNVVLPLLPAHGLKRPSRAFHQLKHTDWIETVASMCSVAKALGHQVSMGGLSTGGALSVHKAVTDPQSITGGLFLFAAALEIGSVEQFTLQTPPGRVVARLKDQQAWLAKTVKNRFSEEGDSDQTDEFLGIGKNQYRYSIFFYEGSSQLAEVIQEINEQYDKRNLRFSDLQQPVFAAHAKDDDSALFKGVQRLVDNHPNDAIELFAMIGVPHPSVVLKDAIVDDADLEVCAFGNPFYEQMSERMLAFAERYLSG